MSCVSGSTPPTVVVRFADSEGNPTRPLTVTKVIRTDSEWRQILAPEQFRVTRMRGTEPPFCGNLHPGAEPGIYACVGCGLPLFSSAARFESGTGWPSFFAPFASENIVEHDDSSHGMVRTELLCVLCDAHLGHVFSDGPPPTGLRYCLNSAALVFVPGQTG